MRREKEREETSLELEKKGEKKEYDTQRSFHEHQEKQRGLLSP
jgi:hypothetical protein